MRQPALALAAALLAIPSPAQQAKPSPTVPATAPTAAAFSVSNLPSAQPAVRPAAENAKVSWNGSVLRVQSNGDSLRNILRSVSSATGMKITGGVPEEPVFGTYGPGPAQEVLPKLFAGIAINMMLVNGGATLPKELVLTQRTGAPSPPQTRPIAEDEQGLGRVADPLPNPNDTAQEPAHTDASGATASEPDANEQPSPGGVRTPEQIFEELRKRQQQQQSATPQ